MDYSQRTKDELISELTALQQSLSEIKEKFENEIFQLHLAKDDLTKSEEKFRKAFVTSPDSININRLKDGMYVSINNGFTKVMGYTEKDVLGKTSIELNIWKNPEDRKRLVDGLKENGQVENLEAEFVSKNGGIIYGMMSAAIINLSGVPHILNITRDITDRKNAAAALKESEEWIRKLFEQSNDGIFYLDLEGKIIAVNEAFAEMHGFTPDEIRSMNISDLDSMKDKLLYPQRMKKLLAGEKLKFEVDHIRKDGTLIPLEVTASLITIGSKSYLMSSHRDITERRKGEETMKFAMTKAEASDKLKTSFLNNISHEVRTPLNGIIGFSEILTKDTLSQDEKEEAFAMVNECSNRLLDTITNFMDISLIFSGEMNVNKKEFNPVLLLKEIYEKFKDDCSKGNIVLTLNTTGIPDDEMINSDPELVRKVLTHLMNNAVKFTEMGSITLGCKVVSGSMQFYVSDTGIGIANSALKDVFAYFAKEDQATTRLNEGSGLGLSISKGIIGLLGGELKAQSEKGKGSNFYFTLPENQSERNSNISSPAKSDTKKLLSILIAEDDEANFLYMRALIFQNTKAEIIRAVNGREAIEKFKLNRGVDIILMDMKMPDIDGFEATRSIKSIDPGIPVIAVTAYAMLGDEKRIRDAGCDEYMTKPVNKNILLEKMSRFVTV